MHVWPWRQMGYVDALRWLEEEYVTPDNLEEKLARMAFRVAKEMPVQGFAGAMATAAAARRRQRRGERVGGAEALPPLEVEFCAGGTR